MSLFGENASFSMSICDVTTELMNINTGKIDNYKPFKFLLKFALWHDVLLHFSFCLKVR